MKLGIHRQRKGLGLHLGPPIDPSCNYYPSLTFTQQPWGIVVDASPRPTGDEMICVSRVVAQSTNRNFCPTKRTYVDHLMTANEWPYLVWKNGDLDVAEKRYFFAYRIIDGSGRPSSQQIDYVDAARWTDAWTRVADEDTFMFGTMPDTNYGATDGVGVDWRAGVERYSLFGWDLTEIPTAAVVSSGSVYAYCPSLLLAGNVDAHEGMTEWAEMQATYNDRLTGIAWGVAGGQAGVDFVAVAEDTTLVDAALAWYSWGIPVMVGNWVGDSAVNFGLWFRATAGCRLVYFRSSEWGVANERPYISIIFGS